MFQHSQYLLDARQLAKDLSEFERDGVSVIPLRGPALAELLYRDPGLRRFTDLDLFVREADLPRALPLLARLGYRHLPGGHPLSHELTWRHAASIVPEIPDELLIDQQWRLMDYPVIIRREGDALSWEVVAERASRWQIRRALFHALGRVQERFEVAGSAFSLAVFRRLCYIALEAGAGGRDRVRSDRVSSYLPVGSNEKNARTMTVHGPAVVCRLNWVGSRKCTNSTGN